MVDAIKWNPVELIPSREIAQLQLVAVVAAKVPSKLANQVIRALSVAAPLEGLKHLKRVRKSEDASQEQTLDIIICKKEQPDVEEATMSIPGLPLDSHTDVNGSEEALNVDLAEQSHINRVIGNPYIRNLPEPLNNIILEFKLSTFIIEVPLTAPHTREQWQEWCKLWPITWKIPDQSSLPTSFEVGPQDQAYFELHMMAAIKLASDHGQNNAALIVDPENKQIMASACGDTAKHPLDHAAMAAIRAVSQRDLELWSCTLALDRDSQGPSKRPRCSLGEGGNEDHVQKMEEQQQQNIESITAPPKLEPLGRPYMCTGYDCFLVQEPCIMCAMGLVHSRLQRVIYCYRDLEHGALGGYCKLHSQRSLNHHYLVYRLTPKNHELKLEPC